MSGDPPGLRMAAGATPQPGRPPHDGEEGDDPTRRAAPPQLPARRTLPFFEFVGMHAHARHQRHQRSESKQGHGFLPQDRGRFRLPASPNSRTPRRARPQPRPRAARAPMRSALGASEPWASTSRKPRRRASGSRPGSGCRTRRRGTRSRAAVPHGGNDPGFSLGPFDGLDSRAYVEAGNSVVEERHTRGARKKTIENTWLEWTPSARGVAGPESEGIVAWSSALKLAELV